MRAASSPHMGSNPTGGALSSAGDADTPAARGDAPNAGAMLRIWCVIGAILLGQAVVLARPASNAPGTFSLAALIFVVIALAVCCVGMSWRAPERVQRASLRLLHPAIAIALLIALARVRLFRMFVEFPASRGLIWPFVAMGAVAIVLIAALFAVRSGRSLAVCFLLLLTFHGLMGAWYLGISQDPHIDAYVLERDCAAALAQGRDPYTITFPDIYGPGSGYYSEGLVVNGRVQAGYTYPPLTLLMSMPGHLMGDVRYAQLLAISLAGLLVGFSHPTRTAKLAGALLLFTPDVFHQMENAWTEPFLLAVLCAVIWCAARRWRVGAAVAVGLLLVSKQYALLAAPAAWLLVPRPLGFSRAARWIITALISGSIVTLPFILWNPGAFIHSVAGPYVNELRMDSVSFLPLIYHATGWKPTLIAPLIAAGLGSVLVLWRGGRNAGGFAVGVTVILLCAFVFSTHSFANYYFFAAGALCAAVAAGDDQRWLSRAAIST